jgi:hypothetical protein
LSQIAAKRLAGSFKAVQPIHIRTFQGIFSFPAGFTDGIVDKADVTVKLVDNSTAKLSARRIQGDGSATRRPLFFLFLISLLFFSFAGGSAATRADVRNPPATSLGPGLPFAIADFDGDLRPDLASIQAGTNNSGRTSYRIQLQLTSSGRQSIQLFAPAGGLLIEARDVNGDHAIDLVLATAWLRQPVAIFLNDGHGNFSRAELAAFPGAFAACQNNSVSATNSAIDPVGVPRQPDAGIHAGKRSSSHEIPPAGFVPPSNAGFPLSQLLVSQPGRAPPSAVPYL